MSKNSGKDEKTIKGTLWEKILFWCIFITGACFTYRLLGKNTIWYDEAFGMCVVRKSMGEMLHFLTLDVHPPLYYILLKFAVGVFGESFVVYRAVSWIPILLGILVMCRFIRKNYSYAGAILYLSLMLGAPSLLHFAVEIRMYGLCLLFVNLSAIVAFYLIKKQTFLRYFMMAVFCLLAAYTHYFAGAAVMGLCIFTFIVMMKKADQKGKTFGCLVILVGAMVLGYLPWMKYFAQQCASVKEDFWMNSYTLDVAKSIPGYFLKTNNTYATIGLLLVVLLGIFFAWIHKDEKENRGLLHLATATVLFPIVVGLGVSALVRPIFQAKYVFPVMGLMWFVVAIGLSVLKESKKFRMLCAITTVAVVGLCGFNFYQEYQEIYMESTDTEVTDMVKMLKENMADGAPILQTSPQLFGCFAFYYPTHPQYILTEYMEKEYFPAWEEMGHVTQLEDYCELQEKQKQIWVVTDSYHPELVDELAKCGYHCELMGEYEWVTYTGFDIAIYYATQD